MSLVVFISDNNGGGNNGFQNDASLQPPVSNQESGNVQPGNNPQPIPMEIQTNIQLFTNDRE